MKKDIDIGALHLDDELRFTESSGSVRIYHRRNDQEGVFIVEAESGGTRVLLLPSKGLSILQAYQDSRQIFWDPPLRSIPNSDYFDPFDDFFINGEKATGSKWLRYFLGGVEMLGIDNWGMPYTDPESGRRLPLHGEASVRPIRQVELLIEEDRIQISGAVELYDKGQEYGSPDPWYQVIKRVSLFPGSPEIRIHDSITNQSLKTLYPDWGYHIQLKAEEGAEYLVPAERAWPRGGGKLPEDFKIWKYEGGFKNRVERGFVYQGFSSISLPRFPFQECVETLLKYPDDRGLLVSLPHSPYFQSWFSSGGKETEEFMFPKPGGSGVIPVLDEDWNGIGPEFGASAVDHDGTEDPDVGLRGLGPGDTFDIGISIEAIDGKQSAELAKKIQNKGI